MYVVCSAFYEFYVNEMTLVMVKIRIELVQHGGAVGSTAIFQQKWG